MMVPSIQVLKDLNKVLLFAEALSKNSAFPERETILKAASSISYGDKKGHEDSLIFLKSLGLVNISNNHCQITPIGKSFLELNPNKYIETNKKQKRFILQLFLKDKKFQTQLLNFLNRYGFPGRQNITIDSSVNISSSESFLLSALKWLEFFRVEEGILVVNPKDITFLTKRQGHGLSLRQLESILKAASEYSREAEKLALEFEKKRLKQNGLIIQSNLVKLVADKNVSLGYDLLSYSNKNSFEYDRFIEVKCSKGVSVKFFWSRNEYLTAKRLKDKYWIYFFPKISTNKKPLLFKNPSQTFKPPKYNVITTEFVVEEN